MINSFIAILIEKKVLTQAEGEAIAKKLQNATLPYDFPSSHAQIKKFFKQIDIDI
jgi:hypothetical protein